MKIAILLSTYNGEKYLNSLLNSIYNQSIDAELILIIRDDGSKDNTISIIGSWQNRLNINLVAGENLGPKNSFVYLINNAPFADYYAFCDQDDVWHRDKLTRAIKIISKGDLLSPKLYFSNALLIDKDGNSLYTCRDKREPNITIEGLFVSNPALGCTMVFNYSLLKCIRKINFKYYYMHDAATIICAVSVGNVFYDIKPSLDYRQHKNAYTQGHQKVKNVINKINFWFFQKEISIAFQAKDILEKFKDNYQDETLRNIADYKRGLNRFKLAFNKKYRINEKRANCSFVCRVLLGEA